MRYAVRRWIAAAAVLAALVLASTPGPSPHGAASTALADDGSPTVTLTVTPAGEPLGQQVNVTATTTGLPATSIASIEFEYAPVGTDSWTSLGTYPGSLQATVPVDTTTLIDGDGLYNLRALLTEADGTVIDSATLADQLVANSSPYVTLSESGATLASGSAVRSTIPLIAQVSDPENVGVATVSLQISPQGAEDWTTVSTQALSPSSNDLSLPLDTTGFCDGSYDLRAVPTDNSGITYASVPIRNVIIENTPPPVTLDNPGSTLTGSVTLSVEQSDNPPPKPGCPAAAGPGIASVEYERAIAGTNAWTQIGSSGEPPFSTTIDTSGWPNGSYDLRAQATDRAGNVGQSGRVTVQSSNPPPPPPAQRTISGLAVPAHLITMLGSVAGSPDGEAWADGYTSAPPATVDGSPLPYTAEGDQFVLLRYSDTGGWQIADVLRNQDGSAFQLLPPAEAPSNNPVQATGAMAPDGEAWLWVYEPPSQAAASLGVQPVYGLFHRQPGGAFAYDQSGTQAIAAFGSTPVNFNTQAQMRLGTTPDGQLYGIFINPDQPQASASVAGANGAPVPISEGLEYALLQGGAWTDHTASLPPAYTPGASDEVTLDYADVSGPGTGWGALRVTIGGGTRSAPIPLLLGQFDGGDWKYVDTGLDALDLTGSVADPRGRVDPTGLKVDGDSVWVGARDTLPTTADPSADGNVVALYDAATGTVTQSWCTLPVADSCDQPLGDAAVPDTIFEGSSGPTALSMQDGALDVYANGNWSSTPVPGYSAGDDTFTDATDGWLGGSGSAIGEVTSQAETSPLASWPLPERAPLTSVALPPGSDGGVDGSGALAVGFDGTVLEYTAGEGWLVQPTPPEAQNLFLTSVAFAGPSSAFAVGAAGEILHWDGSSWSEDPQSISLTVSQLNALAFDGSGQGWAVGEDGTILHYDGQSWSIEQPPATDADTDITSVAVAGSDVFAIAGGNLIVRQPDGTWVSADPSLLPSDPAPTPGSLRLVSGLPDGGAVIAGQSVVLERQNASSPFQYSDQPLEGTAVALSAFRGLDGVVRAAASIAPPAAALGGGSGATNDAGDYPAGDGELVIQTADGWQDLTRAEPAEAGGGLASDGEVKPDPVLGVATSPDGQHAWAVGGYDGTPDAAGQGTADPLAERPSGWQTASLWRYDADGSVTAPTESASTPSLPATPGTVSFAFFSSPMCVSECSATVDAQPDANLAGAIGEINTYAAQPGGPLFAMLGGNAVGPTDLPSYQNGDGAADFAQLPSILAPLNIPLFAAYGPLDAVPTESPATQSWSDAFADSPSPFGGGGSTPGIQPVSTGAAQPGTVARYYSFDASQNGATLRVIVLDNSQGSLEGSESGQTAWLNQQLAAAAGIPTVVVTALPLYGGVTSDGSSVAASLVQAGVLAVFSSDYELNSTTQLNQVHQVPEGGTTTIPEYEGATLGYQETKNDGVVWYDVSVDTQTQSVSVSAVPLVQSLALDPLRGQVVARSLTLQFAAIGRRPAGSLPTSTQDASTLPGYDNYVEIPASGCSSCVTPTYKFTSSNPEIGTFVKASGPNSPYPALNASGHPIASSQSGLFCAFDGGTTTVTVTAGLESASLPVTVEPGGYGSPCGNGLGLANAQASHSVRLGAARPPTVVRAHGSGTAPPPPPPPPAAAATATPAPVLKLPSSPPATAPAPPALRAIPHPAPRAPSPLPLPVDAPAPALAPLPVLALVPPPPIPIQPVPPGGAPGVSQAPSAARRREKAHKHAQSKAFTLMAPASNASDPAAWWYDGAVGVTTVLALLLSAQGLRPRRRSSPARSYARRR